MRVFRKLILALTVMFSSLATAQANVLDISKFNKRTSKRESNLNRKTKSKAGRLKSLNEELKSLLKVSGLLGSIELSKDSNIYQRLIALLQEREIEVGRLIRAKKTNLLSKNLISKKIRESLPEELKVHVEKKVEYKTEVSAAFTDFFEIQEFTGGSVLEEFSIQIGEEVLLLQAPKKVKLSPGTKMKIKGIQLGELILVLSAKKYSDTTKARKTIVNSREQNVLVVLVDEASNSSDTNKLTKKDIEDRFFGFQNESISSFFRESSYGQMSVSGKVINSVKVPNLCSTNSNGFSSYKKNTQRILNQLIKQKISINNYDSFVFLLDEGSQISHSCFAQGVQGYGSIGKTELKLKKNKKKASFIFLASKSLNKFYLEHEFGHILGARHANSYYCRGESTGDDSKCSEIEMGDPHSIMGNLAKEDFGALRKEQFNWLKKNQIKEIKDSFKGRIKLSALDDNSQGLKLIKIPTRTGYYAIEFRKKRDSSPKGFFQRFGGAIVREISQEADAKTKILDMRPGGKGALLEFFDSKLAEGTSFEDKLNKIKVTNLSMSSDSIELDISYLK